MNDYAQKVCVFCLLGRCDACVGLVPYRWCEHTCGWLIGGTDG
jgi:hypothetical protein